jgi:cyclopropane fatty-acyl-phospholipid synthase-like methyltransferase
VEFLELKNISERYLELLNPTTAAKVVDAGRAAGMQPGQRVIDFGCGCGEALILWARAFGVSGLGVDIRPAACERAREKIEAQGLDDQIEIACGDAAQWALDARGYDIAACIGATFIWKGGFQEALRAMRRAIQAGGPLVVGEVHWMHEDVPRHVALREPSITTESHLLHLVRQERLELIRVLHSSHNDWDHYESENWRGLADWLEENPGHPERGDVLRHLQRSQEEYLTYGREHLGWALYVLRSDLPGLEG